MPKTTNKVCAICGASFVGGFRAIYCPECRTIKRRAQAAESAMRQKAGKARALGSVACCEQCGGDYFVKSAVQRFCPDCTASRHRDRNAHAMDYYWIRKEKTAAMPESEQAAIRDAKNSYNRQWYRRKMEADPGYRRRRLRITLANKTPSELSRYYEAARASARKRYERKKQQPSHPQTTTED